MCLAVPSRIEKIQDTIGLVDVDGVKREVSLLLIEDPQVGEYVIVHAGFAIHRIDESAATESLNLLREGLALADEVA
jgi:hydrogenase expression/formation protein HypC